MPTIGATSLDLPPLSDWQRRVLQRAVRFVGFPYVWGGMSDKRQTLFGVTSRGGFDCSGFVWRVYRLEAWAGAPRLNSTLRNRTAAGMAGEVARARRIAKARLQPGDVMFFGSRGARSKPAEITHAGIALGGGWFVHSSRYGTTIAPFEGWHDTSFAWGRRPLAEAGPRLTASLGRRTKIPRRGDEASVRCPDTHIRLASTLRGRNRCFTGTIV